MKNFRFVLALTVCAGLLTASTASAQLILNGDFSGNGFQQGNSIVAANINGGWYTKGNGAGDNHGWDWHTLSGGTSDQEAQDLSTAVNRYAFGQANDITTETGSAYNFTFDWTQAGTDAIHYQVAAFKKGTDFGGQKVMGAFNFIETNIFNLGTNANGASWIDLLSGTVQTADGGTEGTIGTLAASTTGHSVALNFNGTNIEDYDTIAIKFWSSTAADPADGIGTGGVLDNIAITAATGGVVLGDVDLSGAVDFLDIGPFITVLSGGTFQAEADCDESGEVNFLDIGPFIAILAGP